MRRPAELIGPFLLLFAALLVPGAVHAAVFTAQDLVMMKRVSDPRISPDGEHIAYTLRTTDLDANKGVKQVWMVDRNKGRPRQVTSGGGNSHTPRWGADGQLYFLSNRSGSNQVWRLDPAGGEAQAVTSLPLEVGAFAIAPTGDRIALAMDVFPDCASDLDCSARRLKEQGPAKVGGHRYERLFVRHWDTWKNGTRSQLFGAMLKDGKLSGTPALVSRGLDGDVPTKPFGDDADFTFAPDGRALVFTLRAAGRAEAWSTNTDLWRAPVDGSAAPENLTPDNAASDFRPLLTPDGKQMAWLAMRRPGFESDRAWIRLRDLKTGATRDIAPKWDRSPSDIALSSDGRTLYAVADDQGQSPLFAIQLSSGIVRKLSGAGTVSGFSVAEAGVVYALNRLDAPDDLYFLGWNGNQKRLTQHNADRLNGIALSAHEFFSFRGWNDEAVQGYVMKPAGFTPGGKYPVAFIIHGGPQGSMGNDFHYRWNPQVFAGRGYAVVAIDFHGSTGYGQAFTDSISQDWGGKPLVDLQKGLAAALSKYDWLDGSRACALGASYGGYMVNWIAGTWPGAFKCLVNHDGVFDQRSMAYTTDELWFDEWEVGGTPYERPEAYERFNPVNHVAKWSTPMLVIHGGQDFRVPLEQGIATFTALQRRGIESQFLHFPDENHWVLAPKNSLLWHDSVLGWLDQHLKEAR
ncbi:MAG: Dipeptidyl aminopeptidase/acylaminoacyl peptidase [Panacagrimonas sp.]|nr:S9 family peptidase [Panacagrimonas sp.]MCC2655485.1 Dipeptidyl aminopeptidase/acylaminoacyl peptidase [Panacagrimonas sp.]